MANKHHKPEEIVAKLRQVELQQDRGMAAANAMRQFNVTKETY